MNLDLPHNNHFYTDFDTHVDIFVMIVMQTILFQQNEAINGSISVLQNKEPVIKTFFSRNKKIILGIMR